MDGPSDQSPFFIKNLMAEGRFAFLDARSDFRAVMDLAGLARLRAVFSREPEDLTGDELGVARTLVGKGLAPDLAALRALGPPRERTGSWLSRVEIELTRSCNLSCLHCFTVKGPERFDLELLERNLTDLEQLGAVEVILNGGEILLHDGLEQALDLLRNRFKIILFTNGTAPDTADRIARAGVARVNVSLDGFQQSHERLRGQGTWDQTVGTVRTLVARGVRVQINSVIHDGNLDQLDAFVRYCREDLRACGIKLSTVQPLGPARNHPELYELRREALDREVYEKYLREDLPGLPADRYLPCHAGVTKIFVDAGGAVRPCRLFDGEALAMGSLRKQSLSAIYHGFLGAPSIFTRFSVHDLPACRGCKALPTCKTGCRARALLDTGDLHAADAFSCRHHVTV